MVGLLAKERNYRWLFFSGLVNGIGDRFSQVAVLTMLLELTGSGLAVGGALSIRIIPYLLFSYAGGALSDRISRKAMLIITDLIRIPLALSLLLVHGPDDIWLIYVVLFFLAVGEAIYEPARKSFIFEILHDDNHITKVNILEQSLLGFVLVFGSISGGVFSYLIGTKAVFAINGVSFLAGSLLIDFAIIFLVVHHNINRLSQKSH
ncbi:MFS transporter [Melghiribacillus thermohalophilus]|uniref:MFS transporter n=1 Tax=Melghiribacillus thermohalophilus TaxID=1324956 RepID=A0A4R3NDJ0_9BACI|nr:MFS transporter [Melghiribacillus thermohalophilus]TCT26996.1 MFS transporter [Melghiribacillus thermohalophilus]